MPEDLEKSESHEDLESQPSESHEVVEENGEKSDFVEKYGPVKFRWIERPESAQLNYLIIKPYALNYFYKGVLYRTKEERGSTVFELFFDLLYVGIVGNLAQVCLQKSDWRSIAVFVMLFIPCWQIWSDMREFMNYYYNNDIIQKMYVLWIMVLLMVYSNNANLFVSNKRGLNGLVVGCYMLARFSFATLVLIYNMIFIKEHRKQMVCYCCFVFVSIILAGCIMIPKSMQSKVIIACFLYAWDNGSYIITFSTWFKTILKSRYTTAVNIEHETKRHSAFVVIAIGAFLYNTVALSPGAPGLNQRIAKAIFVIFIAYSLAFFHFSGEGSAKALHAIRRNSKFATTWILLHVPLVVTLELSANAAGTLTKTDIAYAVGPGINLENTGFPRQTYLRDVKYIFGTCLALAIISLTCISLLDKNIDNKNRWGLTPKKRILSRFFVAIVIFALSFVNMIITLYMGISALLLIMQVVFENLAEVEGRIVHHDTGFNLNIRTTYNFAKKDQINHNSYAQEEYSIAGDDASSPSSSNT